MEGSKFLLIGLVLAICAVIFQLIGLASPYWITIDIENVVNIYTGLWKFCSKYVINDITVCLDTADKIPDGWFTAVRAMSILALLALVVALVLTILKLFVMKENRIPQFAAVATEFAAAVFILISIAIFAAKANESPSLESQPYDYHFAFAFCILAMLAAIGAGSLILVDAMKKNI